MMTQDAARQAVQRLMGPGGRVSTTSHMVTEAHVIYAQTQAGSQYAANEKSWELAVGAIKVQVAATVFPPSALAKLREALPQPEPPYVAFDAADAAKCAHCQEDKPHTFAQHAEEVTDWQAGEGDFMREQIAEWENSRGSKDGAL